MLQHPSTHLYAQASQATDPRRLLQQMDDNAKRRRVGEAVTSGDGCILGSSSPGLGINATAWDVNASSPSSGCLPGALVTHTAPQLNGSVQSAAGDDDISIRIADALKRLYPGQNGCAAPPATSPQQPLSVSGQEPEPDISARLLSSLRTLLPTGDSVEACQSSEVGQELLRKVQELAPAQPEPALLALGYGAPRLQQKDGSDHIANSLRTIDV